MVKKPSSYFLYVSERAGVSYNMDIDREINLVGTGLGGRFKKTTELKVIKFR